MGIYNSDSLDIDDKMFNIPQHTDSDSSPSSPPKINKSRSTDLIIPIKHKQNGKKLKKRIKKRKSAQIDFESSDDSHSASFESSTSASISCSSSESFEDALALKYSKSNGGRHRSSKHKRHQSEKQQEFLKKNKKKMSIRHQSMKGFKHNKLKKNQTKTKCIKSY